MIKQLWKDTTIVIVDTETTGKYPLGAELCEVAAIKFYQGQVVDEYSTLIQPTAPMSREVIAIHHITDEMVAQAPPLIDVMGGFYDFVKDAVLMAHHAPFDLGFLAVALEECQLPDLPQEPALCSSLLSRKFIPESPNHRLQTLVKFLGIDGGQAHRALDDARACLAVGLEVFRRCGEDKSIADLVVAQGIPLSWGDYSMNQLKENQIYQPIIRAIYDKKDVVISYNGGSRKGDPRQVTPMGIVRNPQGDFLVANDGRGHFSKRYFLDKIIGSSSVLDL